MGEDTDQSGNQPVDLHVCPVLDRAYGLLGKRWMGLIVDTLRQRPAHFNEIVHALSISKRVLSARLKELMEIGVVAREDEGGNIEYSLTESGEMLAGSMDVMREWAIKYLPPTKK